MFFKKDFNKFAHKLQKSMLKHAEELGKTNGVMLDYSNESIKSLDGICVNIVAELDEMGIHDPGDIEKDESVQGIMHSLGFYIVECLERDHHKGTWMNSDPISKEDVWCFMFKNNFVIYPFDWIIKKLLDPKGYSVATAYAKTLHALDS